MKHRSIVKWLALCSVIALGLLLTGCYIPPEEIDGTQDLIQGSGNLPFNTIAPAATATATRNPATPTPTVPSVSQPTVNWDAWGTTQPQGGATHMPSNTIAVVTSQPTNTPAPATPTPTPQSLKNGMSGQMVREMQQRLKTLGYLSGSADGDFGDKTEAAVITFQTAHGLTADGKAGKMTLEKLYSDGAITKAAALNAGLINSSTGTTGATGARPTATPNLTKDIYLQLGSSGKNVRTLQARLIELGWMAGEADGEFGGATQAAVIAYQERAGLNADGVAGPDTLKKLYSSGASRSSSPVSSIGVTLKEGMKGDSVRALQKRLKTLGFLTGTVDGSFGAGTKAAVTAFQEQNRLKADGAAGTSTLNKLYLSTAGAASNDNSNNDDVSSTVSSTGYVTLREGDESSAVKKLQQKLKELGYYSGSVDGKYGSGTLQAVKTFQQMNKLTVDGVAGPATQRAVYGTSTSISYSTLRPGSSGSAVTNLQYTLYELGYYDGRIDGKYGDTTQDAVRAFQIRNNLKPVDGVAGNKTLQKVYSSSAVPALAQESNYTTLRKGDNGDEVVDLQIVLEQLGYMNGITGVYDDATVEAVRLFQKAHGLSQDGTAGPDTQAKLYSDSAKSNPY